MSSAFNFVPLTPVGLTADPVNGPVLWKYGSGVNAGVVSVDTTASTPTVSYQLYNASGSLGSSYLTSLTLADINAGLSSVLYYRSNSLSGGLQTMGI